MPEGMPRRLHLGVRMKAPLFTPSGSQDKSYQWLRRTALFVSDGLASLAMDITSMPALHGNSEMVVSLAVINSSRAGVPF
jgi:hypothetical protein